MGSNEKRGSVLILVDAILIGFLSFFILLPVPGALVLGEDLQAQSYSLNIAALGLFIGSIFTAVIAVGRNDLFLVGLIMAVLGTLLLFASVLMQAHFFLIRFYEDADPNWNFPSGTVPPSKDGAYWGSFVASLVAGLGIPTVALAVKLTPKKNEQRVEQEDQPVEEAA